MAFINVENGDFRIEEVFSLRREETEKQTDLLVLNEECEELIKMEGDQYKTQHDFTPEEKYSGICSETEHISSGNTAGMCFTCHQCGKNFYRNSDRKRHIRVHVRENPFTCQKCGKRFDEDCDFTKHMVIHSENDLCVCQQCGKKFTRFTDLEKHIRIHTGEKPYSCQQCGSCFNQSSALKRHIRIHLRANPLTCRHCGEAFNQKSDFSQHMIIHTRNKHPLKQELNKHSTIHTAGSSVSHTNSVESVALKTETAKSM